MHCCSAIKHQLAQLLSYCIASTLSVEPLARKSHYDQFKPLQFLIIIVPDIYGVKIAITTRNATHIYLILRFSFLKEDTSPFTRLILRFVSPRATLASVKRIEETQPGMSPYCKRKRNTNRSGPVEEKVI
jgi:hypothetical protein